MEGKRSATQLSLKVFGLERIERCKALSMFGIGKERLVGYKMVLNLEFAYSNANPAQAPAHQPQDDAHDHIGNCGGMIIIAREQLEYDQKPN